MQLVQILPNIVNYSIITSHHGIFIKKIIMHRHIFQALQPINQQSNQQIKNNNNQETAINLTNKLHIFKSIMNYISFSHYNNTSMRIIITLIIALAICHASAQKEVDMTGIPQAELKALEQAVKFKKAQAEEQMNNLSKNKGNFFSSLFGSNEGQNNKLQFSRIADTLIQLDDEQNQEGQQPFNVNQIMKNLPYEALLPRRRQPLALLNKFIKGEEEESEQSEVNPLKKLDQLLSGGKNKNKEKKFHWQNPDFKEGKRDAPYMKIFGPKSKGKNRVTVKESNIKMLLVKSMPSLEGGQIIKLSSVPYRKGIFLNIEYETAKEQIYTIKAKYVKKTNELQIINLTQINVLRKVEEPDISEDDSEVDETDKVAKETQTEKTVKQIRAPKQEQKPAKVEVLKISEKESQKKVEEKKVDEAKQETKKNQEKKTEEKKQDNANKQPQIIEQKKAQVKNDDAKKQSVKESPKIEDKATEQKAKETKEEAPKPKKSKQVASQLRKEKQSGDAIVSN